MWRPEQRACLAPFPLCKYPAVRPAPTALPLCSPAASTFAVRCSTPKNAYWFLATLNSGAWPEGQCRRGATAPAIKLDMAGPEREISRGRGPARRRRHALSGIFATRPAGVVLAFSDRTNWRGVTDRAVVS